MKAGYAVTAIDAFADKQVAELADNIMVVNYDGFGLNADDLLTTLDSLDLTKFIGFVYGSGFEAQPDLLQAIALKVPLIGNLPATVSAVKTVDTFFSALQRLNIKYPNVYKFLPADADSVVYLRKTAGGCGGAHIKFLSTNIADGAGDDKDDGDYYYQQWIGGKPVSVLFVANGHQVEIIGFNEQWVSATKDAPFRYGGAASHVELSQEVRMQLYNAAEQLTVFFGLRGLNSLDAIVEADEDALDILSKQVYVLEVNPRLSATADLYANIDGTPDVNSSGNLLDKHIQASLNSHKLANTYLRDYSRNQEFIRKSKAHAVVYAASDMEATITWPIAWKDWVVDNPSRPLQILAGEPVCTAVAFAEDAQKAKRLAQDRVKKIQSLLQLNTIETINC